jgi:hypothetical protein
MIKLEHETVGRSQSALAPPHQPVVILFLAANPSTTHLRLDSDVDLALQRTGHGSAGGCSWQRQIFYRNGSRSGAPGEMPGDHSLHDVSDHGNYCRIGYEMRGSGLLWSQLRALV